jgi:predicted DNA-binding transcriptional regulator AlpA
VEGGNAPPSEQAQSRPRNGDVPVSKLEIINFHEQLAEEFPQPFNILNELSGYHRLLSVKEVAAIFGRSESSIYRWARKRQMPSLMNCGARQFDPSTLVLWLQKKEPQLLVAARYFNQKAA